MTARKTTTKKTATKTTTASKTSGSKPKAAAKPGLYANIHAKQERIAHGSGEHMRKKGEAGRPSSKDFKDSEKTAKK